MKPSACCLILIASLSFAACGERDIRNDSPQRTRTADGIVKLYQNREQGDWMLRGKVIQVDAAVVVDVDPRARRVSVSGREILTPIPIELEFHPSEAGIRSLAPGDVIAFKGWCTGMGDAIGFDACVLVSVTRGVPGA